MFRNYLRTALQIFGRHKAFTAINIIGLAIGISSALVIFLIVQYDYSFDKFEKNRSRIYRVVEQYTRKASGNQYGSTSMPDPLPAAVQREVTGLETVAGFTRANTTSVSVIGKEERKSRCSGTPKKSSLPVRVTLNW